MAAIPTPFYAAFHSFTPVEQYFYNPAPALLGCEQDNDYSTPPLPDVNIVPLFVLLCSCIRPNKPRRNDSSNFFLLVGNFERAFRCTNKSVIAI